MLKVEVSVLGSCGVACVVVEGVLQCVSDENLVLGENVHSRVSDDNTVRFCSFSLGWTSGCVFMGAN